MFAFYDLPTPRSMCKGCLTRACLTEIDYWIDCHGDLILFPPKVGSLWLLVPILPKTFQDLGSPIDRKPFHGESNLRENRSNLSRIDRPLSHSVRPSVCPSVFDFQYPDSVQAATHCRPHTKRATAARAGSVKSSLE